MNVAQWTEVLRASTGTVTARCDIADNPAARHNDSAKRGDLGVVDDYADGLFWVSFEGRDAIPCTAQELAP